MPTFTRAATPTMPVSLIPAIKGDRVVLDFTRPYFHLFVPFLLSGTIRDLCFEDR